MHAAERRTSSLHDASVSPFLPPCRGHKFIIFFFLYLVTELIFFFAFGPIGYLHSLARLRLLCRCVCLTKIADYYFQFAAFATLCHFVKLLPVEEEEKVKKGLKLNIKINL